ncbi:MAG TPA: hypothetical protein VFZ76_18510 [Anaerolineales bacterium]
MNNNATASNSLKIAVAGLTVKLLCEDAALLNVLVQRYRDFVSERPAHLEASVWVTGRQRSSSLLDTGVKFEQSVLRFTAAGYEGFIDARAGRAELHLSSHQPVEEIEYFLRIIYALLAFDNQGLLFHAAGIVRADQAYLFFGHSGAGKTTAARVSAGHLVLNDDLVLLIPEEAGDGSNTAWMVYGTPFWNPSQVKPASQGAQAAGLFRLVQDERVFIEPMRKGYALAELISNVPVIPDDPDRNDDLIVRCLDLLGSLPAYRLHFLPDDSFWRVIAAADRGGNS